MQRLSTYLPMTRRQALAARRSLLERAALFASVVGSTRLTDKLVARFGARRGAEELLRLLNAVYGPLIAQVHRHGGSVVGSSGNGFTCWFDGHVPGAGQGSLRATAWGLALHRALQLVASASTPGGDRVTSSPKGGHCSVPSWRTCLPAASCSSPTGPYQRRASMPDLQIRPVAGLIPILRLPSDWTRRRGGKGSWRA